MKADLFISASYGVRIPIQAIRSTKLGGLNVHPSLLPLWRGADPVPWAILSGDRQTGVSIVTLSQNFDEGLVIAQKKISITDRDTSDPLRTKLFTIGAALLVTNLSKVINFNHKDTQPTAHNLQPSSPYARKLTREDGFIPWELIQAAMDGQDVPSEHRPKILSLVPAGRDHLSLAIARAWRALSPWPGIWTLVPIKNEKMRLKILRLSLIAYRLSLKVVQLEGKKPVSFDQFNKAYVSHIPS